jgi:hypothetical protein
VFVEYVGVQYELCVCVERESERERDERYLVRRSTFAHSKREEDYTTLSYYVSV